MSGHKFRQHIRKAFYSGSCRKLVKYKSPSFLKDINVLIYKQEDDGAYRIYNGRVYFTHVPDMKAEFMIVDLKKGSSV